MRATLLTLARSADSAPVSAVWPCRGRAGISLDSCSATERADSTKLPCATSLIKRLGYCKCSSPGYFFEARQFFGVLGWSSKNSAWQVLLSIARAQQAQSERPAADLQTTYICLSSRVHAPSSRLSPANGPGPCPGLVTRFAWPLAAPRASRGRTQQCRARIDSTATCRTQARGARARYIKKPTHLHATASMTRRYQFSEQVVAAGPIQARCRVPAGSAAG